MSPNNRNASRRAAVSSSPRARSSSTRLARCPSSSSSTSARTSSGRRRRYENGRSGRSAMTSAICQHRVDCPCVAPPRRRVIAELLPAGGRERVVAGPAVGLRRTPLGIDEPTALQPVERLVEGGILEGEVTGGPLVDRGGDPIAVHGRIGEGAKDQQVDGALEERERRWRHCSP